jgi:hypothetical protein
MQIVGKNVLYNDHKNIKRTKLAALQGQDIFDDRIVKKCNGERGRERERSEIFQLHTSIYKREIEKENLLTF